MKIKSTALALLLTFSLGLSTVSAMSEPVPSSEDPEITAVWEFFLPFLTKQSATDQDHLRNKFVDLINTMYDEYEDDFEDYDFDDEDYEDFDYSTEKPEILSELAEEIDEIEDDALIQNLQKQLSALKNLKGEAFNEGVDNMYDQLDEVWDDFGEDFDDEHECDYDWDDENYDDEGFYDEFDEEDEPHFRFEEDEDER